MLNTAPTYKKIRKSDVFVDEAVGRRLKLRRTIVGMSQRDLAKKVGISFQQIQKYEKGANRISAGKLYDLSLILNVPVSFFFHDISVQNPTQKTSKSHEVAKKVVDNSQTLELVKNFLELPQMSRKNLISLLKEMVKTPKQCKRI